MPSPARAVACRCCRGCLVQLPGCICPPESNHEEPAHSACACLLPSCRCLQVRTNAMKFLTKYFKKGQLTKLFFLFAVRAGGRGACRLMGRAFVCSMWDEGAGS